MKQFITRRGVVGGALAGSALALVSATPSFAASVNAQFRCASTEGSTGS